MANRKALDRQYGSNTAKLQVSSSRDRTEKHCSDILVVHLRPTLSSAICNTQSFEVFVLQSVNPEGVINVLDQQGLTTPNFGAYKVPGP